MKHSIRLATLLVTTSLLWPVTQVLAQAQPAPRLPVSIRKVDGVKAPTPIFAVKGASSQSTVKEWLRVFAEYDSEPDWIDELNFTFYVLVEANPAKHKDVPRFSLFKGETSYIHVPLGKRHIADMFIHPNMLSRYGDIKQLAVEVRQAGRLVGQSGKPEPRDPWWNNFTPVENVLMDRSQTPFSLVEIDNQEIIKPK